MGCCTTTPAEHKPNTEEPLDFTEQEQFINGQQQTTQNITASETDDEEIKKGHHAQQKSMEDRIKVGHKKFHKNTGNDDEKKQDTEDTKSPGQTDATVSIHNKQIIETLTDNAPNVPKFTTAPSSQSDALQDMISTENLRYIILEMIARHNKDVDTKASNMQIRKVLSKWRTQLDELYFKLLDSYDMRQDIDDKEIWKATTKHRLTDDYKLGKKLGRGAYAVVKYAKRSSDNKLFAAKVINKRGLNKWDLRGLRLEIALMRELEHANIVRLFDVFESPSRIGLIIGLLRGGELLDVVIEKGSFSEHEASQCFAQLCDGLKYIHSKHIAHRDLKPDNLLFATKIRDWNEIPKDSLKLVDFGLAERCRKKALTEYCGTPIYMAPEIFSQKPYNYAVDLWSAGCVLYALLVGYPPFDFDESHDINALTHSVMNDPIDFDPEYWSEISADAKDLIVKLLERDPKKRLSAAEALDHKWMKSASKELFDQRRMDRLRKFQHVRKLKRGVNAMIAVIRLVEIFETMSAEYQKEQETKGDEDEKEQDTKGDEEDEKEQDTKDDDEEDQKDSVQNEDNVANENNIENGNEDNVENEENVDKTANEENGNVDTMDGDEVEQNKVAQEGRASSWIIQENGDDDSDANANATIKVKGDDDDDSD